MTSLPSPHGPPWPSHNVTMPIEIGGVRGTTRNVAADNVVFASPVSFAVGSAISFVIAAPEELRLECSGVVTEEHVNPNGGFETVAAIQSIRIVPLQT